MIGVSIKTVVIFTTDAFSLINFRGNLIKELVKKRHVVHTVAPNFNPKNQKILEELGVITHDCYFERTGTNIISDLKASVHLYYLLKSLNPDCMLSYSIKPVIYGTICGFFAGVNHRVAMIEGLGSLFSSHFYEITFRHWLRRFLVSKMYKFSLYFSKENIFLNQDDIDEFDNRGILNKSRASLLGGIGVDLKNG
ncbi:hypothetical protein OAJ10_02435 [Paracoccaceae bacterium]|nr:hypothetical protein [Paracoccaceae bacterium]